MKEARLALPCNRGYSQISSMRAVFSTSKTKWAVVLGLFCIALVLMSGMAQAAHFHINGQPDHDCALCQAIHHVARVPAAVELHFNSRLITALIQARAIRLPRSAVFFQLVTRPPPADLALSA